ncbi:MAG: glycosyltransferase [Synechococcales bacterium]|nr:glycosyltransferase [Synechococcales bacterium]
MHVLVYTDSAGIGGAEISLGHLVANASPEITVMVVGVSAPVVNAIAKGRPQAQSYVLPAAGWGAWRSHLATFHRLQPDLVHINLCTPWAGATGLMAALTLPRSRVVRVDQLPLRTTHLPTWLRTRSLSLRVDAHVAVGQACSRKMEDFYALGRHTVISIPNGVPDVDLESLGAPSPQFSEKKGFHIGSIGRLDPMKGHDILLRAVAQLDSAQVTILGEGAYRGALEQLAADLGMVHQVTLPGWVDAPRPYLSTFDVVAQPSRSEGFPLTVVEAMLAARPIVATRVGSMAEAIAPGETGLLVEKDDASGLAAALHQLQHYPRFAQRLGQQARAFALRHFTVQSMVAQYEHLWGQLLSQGRVRRLWVGQPQE